MTALGKFYDSLVTSELKLVLSNLYLVSFVVLPLYVRESYST